ncbi:MULTISPECIES: response regulator [unclassified Duganella]|jgi:two-component system chemotaxis response regulator CheY|uniref:response regulator n=1 Tax=unclassified Duganella TaxID=2636909 RepID=UPI0008806066|nr:MULTISPECIES: response regulator [unclassified Duganella]SDH35225.1 Response regulator receiver domain-containing protein [Duganella sp. OV458]SDK51747.1 two-component system, chemotaxis family, response regulator CheY [Duganella sp. OV510]
MKVLVVDDDVVSRMVLMHLIDSCGSFEIVEAEDGADAWEQLEAGLRPGICFCDLRMPRLSGMELLQRVKAHAEINSIPFVLVTSANDKDTVQEATKAGAAGYIVKPFQAEQVRVHLAGFLDQAASGYDHHAEAPADTQRRLGINGERLLVYLSGFQNQLTAAATDLESLLTKGEQQDAQVRIDRLHAGCVTLGLHGAAAALKSFAPGRLSNDAVQAVVGDVIRAVIHQAGLVRQAAS